MMNRRTFIATLTGGLLAPFAAEGQQAGKTTRIGYLALGTTRRRCSARCR
jgi:hypothetical protein